MAHSSTATVVRGTRHAVTVTDGSYAESVEQLGGFYLVQTDDLARICGVISEGDAVEIRACLEEPSAG